MASTPTRIGKYDVLEVIGRGGMGVVYKARDPQLGRLVAIKMTASVGDSPELVGRFFREAQSTASLQHPNIVTVYELGDYAGNPYLVMEYLEGRSLDVIIAAKRPLALVDELDIFLDVCRGLNYAHQRSIIHRDIKPANIVVLKTGGVKLVDFGIAHIVGRKLTMPGQVIGSFNYMSPEQINSKPIDGRTDIFSAGIVLYQLITKALPFEAENTAATLMKIVNEPPPPLGKFLNVYPPELESIIQRALAKDRDDRYSTVEEFAVDLRRVREQVRQELVNRHLQEATALIQANELAKAKEEVFQALKWDPHHMRAAQLMREVQLRIQGQAGPQAPREAAAEPAERKVNPPVQGPPESPRVKPAEPPRQSRLEECLQEARKEVDSRRFASALEILKEAQALEPNAPQVVELVQSVSAAREVERRTQELKTLSREIEAAIRWEDYAGACEKAAAALAKFPGEPALLKAKDLAEQRRGEVERNELINQELASAQKLLEQGKNEDVIALLGQAVKNFGQDSRLESLLRFVRDNTDRRRVDKQKNDFLQAAREQLARKDYGAAMRTLQVARSELKDNTEIENLVQFVRDQATAEQRQATIAATVERVYSLTAGKAYSEAVNLLEKTLSEIPEEDLQILLAQTRKDAAGHRRKLQNVLESAEKLLQKPDPDEAIQVLEAESSSFSNDPDWKQLVERARREAEAFHQVQKAIGEARSFAESGQYDAARSRLEECKQRYGRSPQLEQERAKIEGLRVAANCKAVEQALDDAQKLKAAGRYEPALEKLSSVAKLLSDVPAVLRSKFEDLQKGASDGIVQRVRTEIEGYLAAGQLTRAQEILSRTFANITDFNALADLERLVNEQMKRRADAIQSLDEARAALKKGDWNQASELLRRALAHKIPVPQLRFEIIGEVFHAAELALAANWRSCEQILNHFKELEPQHEIPADLLKRVADHRREDAISACLDRSKILQLKGDLQGARREASQLLAIYPAETRLSDLARKLDALIAQEEERARQERAQREREVFVSDAVRRAEGETSLDLRAKILGDALGKYPHDSQLEPRLHHVHDLAQRISDMAETAMSNEKAGEYAVALAKWEVLKNTYRHYPGVDQHIERLKKLSDQARERARTKLIRDINHAINSFDYEVASQSLNKAMTEFPWNDELMALQDKLQSGLKVRGKAQKNLAAAHDAFVRHRWDAGRKAVVSACRTAKDDPVLWQLAMNEAVDACQRSREEEPRFAELMLRQLSELGTALPLPRELLEQVEARRDIAASSSASERTQHREESPSSPGWMNKMRSAFSSRSGGEHEVPRPPQTEGGAPAAPGRVIEFRPSGETVMRAPQPSATEAFMPGSVAPSRPVFPADSKPQIEKAEPLPGNPQPMASPSIIASAPVAAETTFSSHFTLPAGSKFSEETVRRIERKLAAVVGPLARVLVRRALNQATTVDELYSVLASHLPSTADQQTFLATKAEFVHGPATQPTKQEPTDANRTRLEIPNASIDQQTADHAVHVLARYLGPIAAVLVKRAAQQAHSIGEFHLLLAERLSEPERTRFLQELGLPGKS